MRLCRYACQIACTRLPECYPHIDIELPVGLISSSQFKKPSRHNAPPACPASVQAYDATVLAASYSGPTLDILIDQGRDDNFLSASQLLPDNLIAACSEKKIPVVFRLQPVSTLTTQLSGLKEFLRDVLFLILKLKGLQFCLPCNL